MYRMSTQNVLVWYSKPTPRSLKNVQNLKADALTVVETPCLGTTLSRMVIYNADAKTTWVFFPLVQ